MINLIVYDDHVHKHMPRILITLTINNQDTYENNGCNQIHFYNIALNVYNRHRTTIPVGIQCRVYFHSKRQLTLLF